MHKRCIIHYMPSNAAPTTLPTVPIAVLPQITLDFLNAHAIGTKSVSEFARETLNAAALEVAQ